MSSPALQLLLPACFFLNATNSLFPKNAGVVFGVVDASFIALPFQILVTNQVTTRIETRHGSNDLTEEESYLTAALGNTWAHAVNTRLILQYSGNHREVSALEGLNLIVHYKLSHVMFCFAYSRDRKSVV